MSLEREANIEQLAEMINEQEKKIKEQAEEI